MKIKKQNRAVWTGITLLLIGLTMLLLPASSVRAQQTASTATYAAFQDFEYGFMIWRADTGEILVFNEMTNAIYRFPETTYAHLPDNAVQETSPAGLVSPVSGFGRVWANFPYVRAQLGWGTVAEFGYTATATITLGYPGWEQITVPNGTLVRFFHNHWFYATPSFDSPPPVITPPPDVRITSGAGQRFEGGTMLYRADTGTIYVLTDSGAAYTFHSHDYGYLPENPIWETPPPGYVKPILGFGKVWGHHPDIREALGWALTSENFYMMQLSNQETPNWIAIRLPSGLWVDVWKAGSWQYR